MSNDLTAPLYLVNKKISFVIRTSLIVDFLKEFKLKLALIESEVTINLL